MLKFRRGREAVTKPRILIVEDDPDLAEMLDAYFRMQEYDVRYAAFGKDGVQIALTEDIDLAMLDIRLPDINGYEVCRQIRNQRRTQDLPIIFLTEKRDRVDKLQGLELGVVDYITKPFDIHEVRLRVRNALTRAQQQAYTNRITEMPEDRLVEEQLMDTIFNRDNWGMLAFTIRGLDAFRGRYGFVAADDVLRAVALMVRNAAREHGSDDQHFIGHLNPAELLLITSASAIQDIRTRVTLKMRHSREFFYPLADRESQGELKVQEMLDVQSAVFSMSDKIKDLEDLRTKASTRYETPHIESEG
jgi:CheY-like chemotaxis protein